MQNLASAVDRMQGLVQDGEWKEAFQLLSYANATVGLLESRRSAAPKWVTEGLPKVSAVSTQSVRLECPLRVSA